ncbi:hypothetical protein [Pseudomonas sp. WC2]|uniref:hypothetical protein n=1 Tax=Pseudomonas sp. WC2 TaxID=3424773 RepID=UPI003D334455
MPNATTYTNAQILDLLSPIIGLTYSEKLQQLIENITRRPVRALTQDSEMTLDMRSDRINLFLDNAHNITRIAFF